MLITRERALAARRRVLLPDVVARTSDSSPLPPERPPCRVRVCDSDGAVLGAGILLGSQHVLSCAHVLGVDPTPPDIDVIIDFVDLTGAPSARARIAADGWAPPNRIDGADIVLLELETPLPNGPTAPLRRLPVTLDRAVSTCGFPSDLETGLWVRAKLSGTCGPGYEWVQMDATSAAGPVRAGFSGAPVFDNVTHYVIGMVVSTYTDRAYGLSYMLPVETIIRHLPEIERWVHGAKAADLSLVEVDDLRMPDVTLSRQLVSWLKRGTANVLNIITGKVDSPQSTTIRRIINLADREQRPDSVDPRLAQAPAGTVPPPGSIDLAVDATGKTPAEVFQRIAERAGIIDKPTEPTAQLYDSLPPMILIIDGIDDSTDPEALLAQVLEPLADRGHRLLLTFRRKQSPSLSVARSLTDSAPLGSDHDDIADSAEETGDSQAVPTTWMCAGLVPLPVGSFGDPATNLENSRRGRPCEKDDCPAEIERTRTGEPTQMERTCSRCGTPFSLTPKLSAGDLVAGQYEVVGCLARGGLGWVYLAKDMHLDGNYVALKGLINTNDTRALALAVSERRILTTLDHPNIVRIFNFVTHPDPSCGEQTGYIVMEYVDGWRLDEFVKKNSKDLDKTLKDPDPADETLLVAQIIAYGIEILGALDYLHSQDLLYCDMKPSNVIRSADRIKIIDLGACRNADDRQSPRVQTAGYGVGKQEILSRGLTVQSDIHTVGKTLEKLFSVRPASTSGQVSFGIDSFRWTLKRATHGRANSRFPSAAAMSQQLRGVLREILALQGKKPPYEPSTVFTITATLLDAGLGMAPPLDNWTKRVGSDAVLDFGRPSASAVAIGLPVPRIDESDPAVNFLATVSVTDLHWLVDQLATFPRESVEIELRTCRAHLELADLDRAQSCLGKAEEILGRATEDDWRISWHHGLLALASGGITAAKSRFTDVYRALPGEDAPKLALGFCSEELGDLDDAEQYYDAVWRRDNSQVSAAFGLARVLLQWGNRWDAVEILDEVPDVSRHYDAARIAAVRIRAGRLAPGIGSGNGLPTVADFTDVETRLKALHLDGGAEYGNTRDRITTAVREVDLDRVRESQANDDERRLRGLLETSYRRLAGQTSNAADYDVLIDLANAIRPRTRW